MARSVAEADSPSGDVTVALLEMFPDPSVVAAEIVIGGKVPPGAGMAPPKTQLTTWLSDRSVQVHPVPLAADAVTPGARVWVTVGLRISVPPEAERDAVDV